MLSLFIKITLPVCMCATYLQTETTLQRWKNQTIKKIKIVLFLFNRRRKWSRTHTWLRVYAHLNTEKANNKWVFQNMCDLCDMRWSLSKKYTGEGQKFSLKQYLVNKKEYFAPG